MAAAMSESDFQRYLKDRLKSVGAEVIHIHGSGPMQAAGLPDLFVASRVWSGWLELKVRGGVLKTHQKLRLQSFLDRGVPAMVLRLTHEESWIHIESPLGVYVRRFTLSTLPIKVLEELRAASVSLLAKCPLSMT